MSLDDFLSDERIMEDPVKTGPGRSRILIADDEAAIREISAVTLTVLGYQVDEAVDGVEAWNKLQENQYDLLLTDFRMPNLDGLGLIRKIHLSGNPLKIILMSGTMPFDQLNKKSSIQIAGTLKKPFNISLLREAVGKVLPLSPGLCKHSPFAQEIHGIDQY